MSMADPSGLIGIAKEAMAIGKAISESGTNAEIEVVRSLAESLKAGGFSARPELPDIPKHDRAAARGAMADQLSKAVAVVAAKSPAEGEAYKAWLLTAATKAAEAAREGGFFGFGGTLVSEQEQAAMKELAGKLGVKV